MRSLLPIRHTTRDGFLLLAVLACYTPATIAQEKEAPQVSFDGAEVFRHVLHGHRLKPITTIDELAVDPSQTMVIILGNPRILEDALGPLELTDFGQRGGNILIATDFEYQGFGVKVIGKKIVQSDTTAAYGGDVRCPFLPYTALGLSASDPREHPLFTGLNKGIATNCPSHVEIVEAQWSLGHLLDFPKDVSRDPPSREQGVRGRSHRNGYGYMAGSSKFASAGGRVLVIAGHGIFLNGMMLQPETDNFAFTNNAVRWLQEGEKGQTRTKALLVVDGEIIDNFDANLSPPLPPIPLPAARMVNRLLRGLEDERFFQRVLSHALQGNWNRLLAIFLGVATLALVLYGAKKLLQGRHTAETTVPIMVGAPVLIDVVTPALARHRQAMLGKNDYGELATTLIRDWFLSKFDIAPAQWRIGVHTEFKFPGAGFFWPHRHLQTHAKLVLRLAAGPTSLSVSRAEFFQLVDALRHLSRALDDGQATLFIDGKTVRHT